MTEYTWAQWMLFFYLYCFFGWIFESSYVSFMERKWTNRGFLNGPAIPIYGFGAITIIGATNPFRGQYLLEFFFGMLAATVLEYVIGVAMEAIFKVRYWDYSHKKWNFKGYICLESSLCWGVLSIFAAELIQTHLEHFVFSLDLVILYITVAGLTVVFFMDVCASVKEAWGLRNLLIAIEKAKEEVSRLQNELNVFIQDLGERTEEWLKELEQKWEHAEKKRDAVMQDIAELQEYILKNGRVSQEKVHQMLIWKLDEEKGHLMQHLQMAKEEQSRLLALLLSRKNNILRRNPGATSKRLEDVFHLIRKHL